MKKIKLEFTEQEIKSLFFITTMKSEQEKEGSERQEFFEKLSSKFWELHPSNPNKQK
jgi:hypothetical protein